MKLTKRKGFNFFRSYYDVYNELENDNDKVKFIDALLDRQFLGVKPTQLKGMSKFAYISQTNSIDSQVKGYEDKTGNTLLPLEEELVTPTEGGRLGGRLGESDPPALQVEEKGKGKEEVKDKDVHFETFWDIYDYKVGRKDVYKKFLSLSQKDIDKILSVVGIYISSVNPKYKKLPKTWLNGEHWNDDLSGGSKFEKGAIQKQQKRKISF
jgi:hypothetical protein